jgi:hypothetical protein
MEHCNTAIRKKHLSISVKKYSNRMFLWNVPTACSYRMFLPFACSRAASLTASTLLNTVVPFSSDISTIGSDLFGTIMLIDCPGKIPSGTVT